MILCIYNYFHFVSATTRKFIKISDKLSQSFLVTMNINPNPVCIPKLPNLNQLCDAIWNRVVEHDVSNRKQFYTPLEKVVGKPLLVFVRQTCRLWREFNNNRKRFNSRAWMLHKIPLRSFPATSKVFKLMQRGCGYVKGEMDLIMIRVKSLSITFHRYDERFSRRSILWKLRLPATSRANNAPNRRLRLLTANIPNWRDVASLFSASNMAKLYSTIAVKLFTEAAAKL